MINVKYYSFADPITGTVTKDVAWEETIIQKVTGHVVQKNNSIVTQERIVSEDTLEYVLPESNLTELTKEQFYALDTAGESESIKQRRSKRLLRVERAGMSSEALAAIKAPAAVKAKVN
jgi:hypothetical protein